MKILQYVSGSESTITHRENTTSREYKEHNKGVETLPKLALTYPWIDGDNDVDNDDDDDDDDIFAEWLTDGGH